MEHMKGKSNWKRTVLYAGITLLCLLLCVIAAGMIYIGIQIMKAPDAGAVDITPDGYLSVIEDVNGEKTHSLYNSESNRIYVPLNAAPDDLQNAFIAIEDSRFRTHHGIDLRGIARAIVKGITSGGRTTEGASTITQQLLKNNVFEGWMAESTFESKVSRKIQEQYLALVIERKYSKDWILENYLNTINLGGGTRGVQTASQYYFGKDVSELTLAESALIAGITKNPSAYNPKEYPEKSLERQHLVLNAMEEQGYISSEEKASALEEDVIGHLVYDGSSANNVLSWFEDALLVSVVEDLMTQKGMTEEEAWDLIYTGGLTIYSTQDSAIQFISEQAVNSQNYEQNTEQVSVVVTDVETGAVAAIVGGRGEKEASLIYNRATDSIRQPGSTIKIIGEYAAALDAGIFTLGTAVDDAPYSYSDGTEIHNANETYGGMTTIRQAISSSCNVIALKTFQRIGLGRTVSCLERFGITTLTEEDHQEALAIGGTYNGLTNLELTGAYNAIAADGQYIRPYYYTRITDHDGNVILENTGEKTTAVSSDAAKLLTLAMEEVLRSGTGWDAAVEYLELAGKSGTTNDYRDSWFVGFSSAYTCGVWKGNDDNIPLENSSHAKEIWKTIMEQTAAVESVGSNPLVDTSNLTEVTICTKCGRRAVTGLCDQTMQGDITAVEYYASGTEPAYNETCNCHERITLCSDSSMRAGSYCPESATYDCIFLKNASAGTADEAYTADWLDYDSCSTHTSSWKKLWDKLMNNEDGRDEDADNDSDQDENGSEEEDDRESDDAGEQEHSSEEHSSNGSGWNWSDLFPMN
ncbi:MAG: transglycosylase domain-containing protein [Lachnospiraceae bacterium]|nr:transglycosylase domain-containing protein [Lachnospiraceae bacterium]